MARIIITNLAIILLALALCALLLFPTDVQAHDTSLSEQFCKCESEFWFKNLSHFKQSIKTKCLKEKNHPKKVKRHQSHVCNNKSHDEKVLLKKWQKFSDCRCESAMGDFKEVFVCYQIAQFNKVTGEFLGEVSLYKKKGQHLKVGLKFSHKIKVLNDDQWRKRHGFYVSKQRPRFVEKRDQFLIKKYYVSGKISKSESMNKITSDKISPSKYLLIFGNGKSRVIKSLSTKDEKVSNIPFSKFIHNKLKTIIFPKVISKEEKDGADENEKLPNSDQTPSVEPPTSDKEYENEHGEHGNKETDGNQPTTENADEQTNPVTDPPINQNQENADEQTNPITDPPINQNQEEPDNDKEKKKVPSGKQWIINAGGLLFGSCLFVGSVFVAFHANERRRLRNRQRTLANNSLANVPDYNGYNGGRAY